jgi:hypothetical protein
MKVEACLSVEENYSLIGSCIRSYFLGSTQEVRQKNVLMKVKVHVFSMVL